MHLQAGCIRLPWLPHTCTRLVRQRQTHACSTAGRAPLHSCVHACRCTPGHGRPGRCRHGLPSRGVCTRPSSVPCCAPCVWAMQQVRVCQRLGYANVYNAERPAMHYRLRMFKPDEYEVAQQLYYKIFDATAGNGFTNLSIGEPGGGAVLSRGRGGGVGWGLVV